MLRARTIRAIGLVVLIGATVAQAQTIYVSNFPADNHGYIAKFTMSGASAGEIDLGPGCQAFGVAVDSTGNLYVADTHLYTIMGVQHFDNLIEKFTPTGARSTFATLTVGANDLAFDPSGNLYASCFTSIEKFTPSGIASTFASGLAAPGPNGLACDSSGNLYACMTASKTIQKFAPDGGSSTFANTGTYGPGGLGFDSAGYLYAGIGGATPIQECIEKYAPDGAGTTLATGFPGAAQGLAVDPTGNVFVAVNNNTIEKFGPDGAETIFATAGLNNPLFIAIDPTPEPGTLLVLALGGLALLRRKAGTEGTMLRRRGRA
jgi:sugar lactone lactonase YvrE